MAAEIAAADLVLGRAGATTLAELSAVGRPAVLVPLPAAADDHQRKNAQAIERAGGAVVIDQAELTGPGLAGTVAMLAADRGRLARMSEAMRAFARPGAAAAIVDRLLELAGRPDGAGAPDGRGRAR
jgi:UDP-N-acetylglucosamine--N-acetylmuramyl-(pentapeptide) pyrophosphoryl-undecaprenol N-acetylglucosamine transferase